MYTNPIPGRAHTPHEKRAIIERIYQAWLRCPTLRLSQLIYVANNGKDIFYVEDEAFADLIAEFANTRKPLTFEVEMKDVQP